MQPLDSSTTDGSLPTARAAVPSERLLALAQSLPAEPQDALHAIIALGADVLGTSLATAWLVDRERGVFRRIAATPRTSRKCEPVPLEAWTDGSSQSPFTDNAAAAILDLPFRDGDQVAGILHFELPFLTADGELRRVFAAALAQAASTVMERAARERTARELAERERLVADMQMVGRLGSWEWDTATDVITWSDEQLRLHGLDASNGPHDFATFLPLVHPEDRDAIVRECETLIETREPFRIQYRVVRPDGQIRWLEAHGRMISDADGTRSRMIGTSQDVTALRDADAALRASEESYRTLFEMASDAMFVHDPDTGAILDANRKACDVHGSTLEQLQREGVTAVSQTDDNPFSSAEALERVRLAAAGIPQRFEWHSRHRSGQSFWSEVSLERVTVLGKPRVLAIVRVTTERREAEEALRRAYAEMEHRVAERTEELAAANRALETEIAEHRAAREQLHRRTVELEGLFKALPDFYFRVAADGTILDQRAGADAHLYRQPDALPPVLVGMNARDALPPESGPVLRRGLDEVDRTGELVCVEYPIRAGGQMRHYETRIMPIADGTRILVVRDVTERKSGENALAHAKDAAERANRAKSEFLSRMSHELRTPMNSILGFAQVLERADLPAQHGKALQHILRGGHHLLRLINEVLDIARIEAGRQVLSLEPVRIGVVMDEAIGMVRPLSEQFGVRVEEGDPACRDRFVQADRQRLVQVLLNLLSNAIKYNRPAGRVRLTCGAEPVDGSDRLVVRVADTGPGIPAHRQGELFTPFSRLGAEQSEVEGTGLGLALSQRLTEAMGGALSLESSNDSGTVFRLELDLVQSPLQRMEVETLPDGRRTDAAHGPATLLYIEDNLANLALIETVLETRPLWRTIPALQGRIGIELAREHAPDLILLDLHLPDIPGTEVMRRLRSDARTADIPVVVISADATRSTADRLLEQGVAAFLTKPLDIDAFLSTLERLLPDAAVGRR